MPIQVKKLFVLMSPSQKLFGIGWYRSDPWIFGLVFAPGSDGAVYRAQDLGGAIRIVSDEQTPAITGLHLLSHPSSSASSTYRRLAPRCPRLPYGLV